MKKIVLTQGKVAIVDDDIFEELNQFKWYACKGLNTFYAKRNSSMVNGKRHGIKMHHIIIGEPPRGFETDHENGNGLDNQQKNLRFVTKRQNHQNRKHQKSSSQFPGVVWDKNREKWIVRITISDKNKFLGRYTNEFEAFGVYKQAVEAIGEKVIGDF